MADLVTVYQARPNEVARIVGLLESRHLHPVVGDAPDRMTSYREQTHLIRIAVPAVERDMAVGILAETEQRDAARLSHLVNFTNRAVLFVIVVLGFVAVVGFLDAEGRWFALTWIVLCLIVALALIRWAWARKPHN
ncbi:MAG: hypothetical protein JSW27_24920 [Phycisphaerales bacterium]|nr:MAG: hypothetical protein JSW27_24920 [Phycisphaerales bacterium]